MKRWACVVIAMVCVAGCKQRAIVPPDLLPPRVEATGPTPSYRELVDRYNANLDGLDRLWASTDVELAWQDEDGDRHFEKGDGKFIFVPPRDVAMTVEKLGKTYVWAGSNRERFWLFERQDDNAYVGKHANVGKACADPLPLPVHPATVPYLLGLIPLEVSEADADRKVEVIEGYYVIEPSGLALQMMLDPTTARPVRIDLLNARGDSVIVARLRDHTPAAVTDGVVAPRPLVPGSADLLVMGQDARVTLKLSRATTDAGKIQARWFEFETLAKALKPKWVTELDAGCD